MDDVDELAQILAAVYIKQSTGLNAKWEGLAPSERSLWRLIGREGLKLLNGSQSNAESGDGLAMALADVAARQMHGTKIKWGHRTAEERSLWRLVAKAVLERKFGSTRDSRK